MAERSLTQQNPYGVGDRVVVDGEVGTVLTVRGGGRLVVGFGVDSGRYAVRRFDQVSPLGEVESDAD